MVRLLRTQVLSSRKKSLTRPLFVMDDEPSALLGLCRSCREVQKRATNEVWRLETLPHTQVMDTFFLKIKALMLDPSSSFET